jgi:hypothetical protein
MRKKNGFVRMRAKHASRCECGNRIRIGKQIFWHQDHHLVRCAACGPRLRVEPENDLTAQWLAAIERDQPGGTT